jgi:hypothetical protein
MPRVRSLWLAAAACALAGTANAYTPKYLACEGKITIETRTEGKPQTSTEAVHETYVYDDDSKNFYKRSDTRKTEDLQPVTAYTDKEIRWASKNVNIYGASWEGVLDRSSLALKIVYKEENGTRTWAEQCKPTPPPS